MIPFQTNGHRYPYEQHRQFAEECKASPLASAMQQHPCHPPLHQPRIAEAFFGIFLQTKHMCKRPNNTQQTRTTENNKLFEFLLTLSYLRESY